MATYNLYKKYNKSTTTVLSIFYNLTFDGSVNNIILFKILQLSRVVLQNMKKITAMLIIILISISPLFRGLFFEYETYGFMAMLALLCILYLINNIYKRENIHVNKLYLTLGLLLLAGICFSFANAMNARATLRSLLFYLELAIAFVILYDYFYGRKLQFMKAVMIPSVLVGAVAGFVGMLALTGRFNVWQVTIDSNRVGSTFQYANTASVYFLICFIFSVTLANSLQSIYLRSVIIGLGNVSLFAFFLTGSRGGLMVGVLAVIALLLIQPAGMRIKTLAGIVCPAVSVFTATKRFSAAVTAKDNFEAAKWIIISFVIATVVYYVVALIIKVTIDKIQIDILKKTEYISAAVGAIVLLAVVVFWKDLVRLLPPVMNRRLERLFNEGLNDPNIRYRFGFFKDAFKLLASCWLSGLGSDGWKAMYHSVQDFEYTANYVHNHYLQMFVDHGILAFLSFTGLVVIGVLSLLHSYLNALDKLSKSLTAGLLCGYVALAFHSSFDFNLTFASLALLLWAMFAISAVEAEDGAVLEPKASVLGFALKGRWKGEISGRIVKLASVVICALLFSTHALWFTAAHNGQKALDHKHKKNYMHAMIYYEEANRLDPSNTKYTFELAKIYHYFGKIAEDTDIREIWLEKARRAGEISVNGNKNYPDYMNTLVRIYIDSGMPVEALDMAQKLRLSYRYDAETYELLAKSYIDAALYYEKKGDMEKARELLYNCIAIDDDPNLRITVVEKISEVGSPEVLARYRHSKELAGYLKEAEEHLERLNK